MFDPSLGRWLNPDPIGFAGGDENLYRFVGNDPVNDTDPSGLESYDALKAMLEKQGWKLEGTDPSTPSSASGTVEKSGPFGKVAVQKNVVVTYSWTVVGAVQ